MKLDKAAQVVAVATVVGDPTKAAVKRATSLV